MENSPYQRVVDSVEDHPSDFPDVIITDSNTLKSFEEEVNNVVNSTLYTNSPGLVGSFVNIPIWVDERFDGSIMVTFDEDESV